MTETDVMAVVKGKKAEAGVVVATPVPASGPVVVDFTDEAIDLRDRLLNKTRSGLVTEWNERLAMLAGRAGMRQEHVDWQGTPMVVAGRVADRAFRTGMQAALAHVVETVPMPGRHGHQNVKGAQPGEY